MTIEPLHTITLVLRNNPDLKGPYDLSYYQNTALSIQLSVDLASRLARFGASQSDLDTISGYISEFDLTLTESLLQGIVLKVSGAQDDLVAAFGDGAVKVPSALTGIVTTIIFNGFDFKPPSSITVTWPVYPNPNSNIPNPGDVATARNVPEGAGSGQSIGIIQSPGGYDPSDMEYYFVNYIGLPAPPVLNQIFVDGGQNYGISGETTLDVQVAGAIAFDATFNVYFSPGGQQGLFDATAKAIDDLNTVITNSYPVNLESRVDHEFKVAYDFILQIGACLGLTMLHGAGDDGAYGKPAPPDANDLPAQVSYPASSRWITSVGGTKLELSGVSITSEVVWNNTHPNEKSSGATGGGASNYQAVPVYQSAAGIKPLSINPNPPFPNGARGIPDVAANSVPGYNLYLKGGFAVRTGDSATGPFWAAMIAIINSNLQTNLGFLNPIIYKYLYKTPALTDIDTGPPDNNSIYYLDYVVNGYDVEAGYDMCTGCGVPVGSEIQATIQALLQQTSD